MRFSKAFINTIKQAPRDAVLPSHILLLRAGFISMLGSGVYNFLPIGKKALDKIKATLKKELDKSGCLEVSLGFVTPAELWAISKRDIKYGLELLKFKDRKKNSFILGPTFEEVVVNLVMGKVKSYKQLPLHLYQMNIKFRDEMRPRSGLLRCREFIMKDGYSFHDSAKDLDREFNLMERAYSNFFASLDIDFRVVRADAGLIGGNSSKEFIALTKNGEDSIVLCDTCSYSANVEVARKRKAVAKSPRPKGNFAKFYTPDVDTIEKLVNFFGVDPYYIIKAVVKKIIYDNGRQDVVVFFIRGSDTLEEKKAIIVSGGVALENISKDDLSNLNLIFGYVGPIGLNAKFFIDNDLKNDNNLMCGANEPNYHYVGVDTLKIDEDRFFNLAKIEDGDGCCECKGSLRISRGMEIGHIFKLGDVYSKAFNATFLDKNGISKNFLMGCYGIGISRLLAVMVEQHHDERGCKWTKAVVPYQLDIIVSNTKDKEQVDFAENIYKRLLSSSKDIIYDDRKESFGFKMRDFELIGFRYALVIGNSLKHGNVEIIKRDRLIKKIVKKEHLYEYLMEVI